MEVMLGSELAGRYRVVSKLGAGAMGEVYLVEHLLLNRYEALKVLAPRLARTDQFVARLRREARAMNRLQHPNIVSLYDMGRLPNGRFYLTTELADGESLSSLLARSPQLSVSRTVTILCQLADAVSHAHSRGVIHRDLKPDNMIVTTYRGASDFLKVLDFGIAKIIAPDYKESVPLTKTGQIYGTPAYMSPEQVKGEANDPRLDVYAIGCIAYQLLVGEPPFTGDVMSVMHAHIMDYPEPPSRRCSLADHAGVLDYITLRCLEKDPAERFQSGNALLGELRRVSAAIDSNTLRQSRHQGVVTQLRYYYRYNGFDDKETDPRLSVESLYDNDAATIGCISADTDIDIGSTHRQGNVINRWWMLRVLADALIESGCGDFQLLIGIANLDSVEGELKDIESQIDEINSIITYKEQLLRERVASLRFTLSELRFEHERASERNEPIDVGVERQILVLDKRIANLVVWGEEELERLMEQGTSLTAQRAITEERLARIYISFERLLKELALQFEDRSRIQSILHRLQNTSHEDTQTGATLATMPEVSIVEEANMLSRIEAMEMAEAEGTAEAGLRYAAVTEGAGRSLEGVESKETTRSSEPMELVVVEEVAVGEKAGESMESEIVEVVGTLESGGDAELVDMAKVEEAS